MPSMVRSRAMVLPVDNDIIYLRVGYGYFCHPPHRLSTTRHYKIFLGFNS